VLVAAAIGPAFDLELLESACHLAGDPLFDLVDVAVVSRIVEPVPEHPTDYRFVHAIVRDAILFDLPPLRRARLHARVADVVAAARPTSPDLPWHRWEARSVAPEEARLACRAAAADAEAAFAAPDAAEWWARALQLEPADSPDRAALLLSLGRALGRADRAEEGRARILEAIDTALADDQLPVAAQAVRVMGSEWITWSWAGFRDSPTEALDRLEVVLARLDPADVEARAAVLATLAMGRLYDSDDLSASDALSAEAVRLARTSADPAHLATALLSRATLFSRPGMTVPQEELLDELLALPPRPRGPPPPPPPPGGPLQRAGRGGGAVPAGREPAGARER
jgi:hypothetical protein